MDILVPYMPFMILLLLLVIVILVIHQIYLKRKVKSIQADFDKLRLDMLQVRHILRKKGIFNNGNE